MSDINFYQATVTSVGQPRQSRIPNHNKVVGLNITYVNGVTATIWCGPDNGSDLDVREFQYALTCQPGQTVTIKSRPSTTKPGQTVETLVAPEEFQASPQDDYYMGGVEAPPYEPASPSPQAPAAPSPPQQSPQNSPSPAPSPSPPPPQSAAPAAPPEPPKRQPVLAANVYNELSDEQMVIYIHSLRNSERLWREAHAVVSKMLVDLGVEVSPDKEAEITTTFLLERPQWKLEQMGLPVSIRKPMPPDELIEAFGRKMNRVGEGEKPTKDALTALRAGLTRVVDTDAQRHMLCEKLTGVKSTKDMTTRHVSALLDWMDADPERGYEVSATAIVEARRVIGNA